MPEAPETAGERIRFDDEYKGPRWRYGLARHHPVHLLGSSAGGWILYSERPANDPRFPFGTIDFPRALPPDEAERHGLHLLDAPEPDQ